MIAADKLGPNSPLLDRPKRRRTFIERDTVVIPLVTLLVGPARPGRDREPGAGLTGRIPDLALLYAIEGGTRASSKAEAGKRKAAGNLRNMPDLCWPVARGPFIGLYLEAKREGGKARPGQLELHEALRKVGHCVCVFDTVQRGLDVVLAYHALVGSAISEPQSAMLGWRIIAHNTLSRIAAGEGP